MIDLRSDTVTRPPAGMREAIARAEVGDDVFDEDPSVHALQERVAGILGKEDALFVASGTMANVSAIRTHTQPGTEVILDEGSHVYNFESGSTAAISGVQFRPLSTPRGSFTVDDVKAHLRPQEIHSPPTSLVCLENTHNRAGGTIFPIDEMERIGEFARENGIPVHLDGARLWNASVASGFALSRYGASVDSVSVCLSKGLGAPVGSVIAGTRTYVARARRVRKMLGGGMRQVGVLAAAGLYALDHHVHRLAEDHQNARLLAEALAALPGIGVDLESVQTNIVIADVKSHRLSEQEIVARLAAEGVRILAIEPGKLRLVTHLDVSRQQVTEAAEILGELLS